MGWGWGNDSLRQAGAEERGDGGGGDRGGGERELVDAAVAAAMETKGAWDGRGSMRGWPGVDSGGTVAAEIGFVGPDCAGCGGRRAGFDLQGAPVASEGGVEVAHGGGEDE